MDIYSLSASLTLDSSQMEAGLSRSQSAFEGLGDTASDICDRVENAFSDLAASMQEVGQNMWKGLKEGLSDALAGVRSWARSIVAEVKDVMDIHSPSRVFADIGRNMAAGMEQGWEDPTHNILSDIPAQIERAETVAFDASALGRSSATAAGSVLAAAENARGDMTVNLTLDGRVLASVLLDPLMKTAKQKGVSLHA